MGHRLASAVFAAAAIMASGAAKAAMIVEFTESGGDVIAAYSGSLLMGAGVVVLSPALSGGNDITSMRPANGGFRALNNSPWTYASTTYSSGAFGTGAGVISGSMSGDSFSFSAGGGGAGELGAPGNYVPGAPIAGVATFSGRSFASLGLSPGATVISLADGDTITVRIAAAVPAPAAGALLVPALAGLVLACAGPPQGVTGGRA